MTVPEVIAAVRNAPDLATGAAALVALGGVLVAGRPSLRPGVRIETWRVRLADADVLATWQGVGVVVRPGVELPPAWTYVVDRAA